MELSLVSKKQNRVLEKGAKLFNGVFCAATPWSFLSPQNDLQSGWLGFIVGSAVWGKSCADNELVENSSRALG